MALLSGVLQVLPFPIAGPVPLWRTTFCWIALLPLLAALTRTNRQGDPLTPFQGAILGYACGFVWYLGNCYWIYQTMYLYGGLAKPIAAGILVLFCLYLGLYHALFAAIVTALRRSRLHIQGSLLLVPFVWVAVELARARITGLPWDLLGIAQVDNPLLSRLAPLTGAYGLSFVIAGVNALWLVRIRLKERRHTRSILTVAGVVLVLLYLAVLRRVQPPAHVPTTAVATLVQHNLSVGTQTDTQESTRQMLDSFTRLSLFPPAMRCNGIPELPATRCADPTGGQNNSVEGLHAILPTSLIVWPESPSNFEERDPAFRSTMSTLAHAMRTPVIAGNIGIDPNPATKRGYSLYNSADLIAPDGTFTARYDKIHLVPFGEYVPFKSLFFFAGNLLGEVGTFDSGTHRTVLSSGDHHYGTFICYESIFGDEVRQFAKQGADVLVNISNDGWYGDTSAPWQHLNMVRMRAIENHRWVLRATNTGVTAAIDPYGRVTSAAPRHIRTALRVAFGYETDITFYTAHGDLFAWTCVLISVLALTYGLLRRHDSTARMQ
ncbi:apolipoprotein N-acyltransferase [Granulicella sp. dw_53]|uniref:apolipoprotein N-acyltransferase n=1 Tax=Granulicella sp. dw_53 TaxID=2719792 RepID=UPI001BD4AB70|nr:apolipoprotein N-acyltransferase [Granulicella sp. dw_53]